jgi:hypothetical protein
MASIRKETQLEVSPEHAWSALRDWARPHECLVPGFVTATELDGRDRIVTFFNGAVARELLVDLDDEARRLVWSVVDGPYTHHNASAQVLPGEDGGCRFVWIADLLPDEAEARTEPLMERGIRVIKETFEAGVGSAA